MKAENDLIKVVAKPSKSLANVFKSIENIAQSDEGIFDDEPHYGIDDDFQKSGADTSGHDLKLNDKESDELEASNLTSAKVDIIAEQKNAQDNGIELDSVLVDEEHSKNDTPSAEVDVGVDIDTKLSNDLNSDEEHALLSENENHFSSVDESILDDEDDIDAQLKRNAIFLASLGFSNETQIAEEEVIDNVDEPTHSKKISDAPKEDIDPPLFVMRDDELDPEQIVESSASETNTETKSETNTESIGMANQDKLRIEEDKVKFPSELLSKRYKLNVIFAFNKPDFNGNRLKAFEVNSPEGCIDLKMRNGSVIKDYGKGFSVSGDSERELGLAAIKMAKMKGWKCIKASGDPAYLAELETLCRENGLGLRRTDIDYARILNRVNPAIEREKASTSNIKEGPGKGTAEQSANGNQSAVEELPELELPAPSHF
jgi:hypothetical protein